MNTIPAKKKTKKVAKKRVVAKKKVAKKATKKTAVSKKKAVKKKIAKKTPAKKKVAKKKIAKKTPAKKKVAEKKSAKKTPAKKKAAKKKSAKKTPAKKKVVKKTAKKKKVVKKKIAKTILKKKAAKKVISKKKTTTGNIKKKAMGKVTNIKKSPTKKTIAPYKQKRKNEDYMGVEQSHHFRLLLLAWKKELMEEVDRTVHHMQDDASNFPDPNDRATQEEEFALELRTRDRERKLIAKIDESVVKLDCGDYGFCEVCGIEIGVRRLEARPTATQCIDCKTLDEIKERHLG